MLRANISIWEDGHEQYIETLELTPDQLDDAAAIIIQDENGEFITIPKSAWAEFLRRCKALPLS